uniref:Uncharacterized protein n=1 Tax=Oryza brachyantha TaxID=4533 RepID=J3L580_ORYBR
MVLRRGRRCELETAAAEEGNKSEAVRAQGKGARLLPSPVASMGPSIVVLHSNPTSSSIDSVPQITGPQQLTQEAQILLTTDPVLYSSLTPFILLENAAIVHDSIRRSGKRMHRINHADPPMEAGQH